MIGHQKARKRRSARHVRLLQSLLTMSTEAATPVELLPACAKMVRYACRSSRRETGYA